MSTLEEIARLLRGRTATMGALSPHWVLRSYVKGRLSRRIDVRAGETVRLPSVAGVEVVCTPQRTSDLEAFARACSVGDTLWEVEDCSEWDLIPPGTD